MSAGNHLHSGTNVVALIVCGTYVLVTAQVYITAVGCGTAVGLRKAFLLRL